MYITHLYSRGAFRKRVAPIAPRVATIGILGTTFSGRSGEWFEAPNGLAISLGVSGGCKFCSRCAGGWSRLPNWWGGDGCLIDCIIGTPDTF